MRVLVLDVDVFSMVGGGQTFYRKMISDHPDLEFVYFGNVGTAEAACPPNCTVMPLPLPRGAWLDEQPFLSQSRRAALSRAMSFAEAVAGQTFDVADVPDYNLVGPYLRDSFKYHGVVCAAVAHSMHGVISDSLRLDWLSNGVPFLDLRALEEEQFLDATVRYSLSERYANEWSVRYSTYIHRLDPFCVVESPTSLDWSLADDPPELVCIGRRERRKGNDIAIEIAAWLDPAQYGGLSHIGASSPTGPNGSGDDILARISAARGIPWRTEGPYAVDALSRRLSDPVIALLPVRYDSFNLTALEAVARGVPSAVSVHAGAADFLKKEKAPALLPIWPERPAEVAAALQPWLEDYPTIRGAAVEFAQSLRGRFGPMDIRPIYRAAMEDPTPARAFGHVRKAPPEAERISWPDAVTERIARRLEGREHRSPPMRAAGAAVGVLRAIGRRQALTHAPGVAEICAGLPERSDAEISAKIALIGSFDLRNPGRLALFSELGRLERLRGRMLEAACYDIRCMRLSGKDDGRRLAATAAVLRKESFEDVAKCLEVQYGPPGLGDLDAVLERREKDLRKATPRFDEVADRVIDRRDGNAYPVVSVLVSVYDSGTKFGRFLDLLARQTLFKQGKAEVVVIDACSPQDEWATAANASPDVLNAMSYVRTRSRITIQAAWNVGLQMARGRFVSALGIDETLYPDALGALASVLSKDASIDWAMSSSVATDVAADGAFQRDKMVYDRQDAERDMTFLDTTYVSWVGGLYRRDVHDRFGYYDPQFRAAGDTEFKMRVLPKLRARFIPQTLGVFMDYPEQRATVGPRAEIEDLLAWYVHRTPVGVRKLLATSETSDLRRILSWCGGRRKCFSAVPSTDVELGVAVGSLYASRTDAPADAERLQAFFMRAQAGFRDFDMTFSRRGLRLRGEFISRSAEHNRAFEGLMQMRGGFEGFNDNRFEQHGWVWAP